MSYGDKIDRVMRIKSEIDSYLEYYESDDKFTLNLVTLSDTLDEWLDTEIEYFMSQRDETITQDDRGYPHD